MPATTAQLRKANDELTLLDRNKNTADFDYEANKDADAAFNGKDYVVRLRRPNGTIEEVLLSSFLWREVDDARSLLGMPKRAHAIVGKTPSAARYEAKKEMMQLLRVRGSSRRNNKLKKITEIRSFRQVVVRSPYGYAQDMAVPHANGLRKVRGPAYWAAQRYSDKARADPNILTTFYIYHLSSSDNPQHRDLSYGRFEGDGLIWECREEALDKVDEIERRGVPTVVFMTTHSFTLDRKMKLRPIDDDCGHPGCSDPFDLADVVNRLHSRNTEILLVICGCRHTRDNNIPAREYAHYPGTSRVRVLFVALAGAKTVETSPASPTKQTILEACETETTIAGVLAAVVDNPRSADYVGVDWDKEALATGRSNFVRRDYEMELVRADDGSVERRLVSSLGYEETYDGRKTIGLTKYPSVPYNPKTTDSSYKLFVIKKELIDALLSNPNLLPATQPTWNRWHTYKEIRAIRRIDVSAPYVNPRDLGVGGQPAEEPPRGRAWAMAQLFAREARKQQDTMNNFFIVHLTSTEDSGDRDLQRGRFRGEELLWGCGAEMDEKIVLIARRRTHTIVFLTAHCYGEGTEMFTRPKKRCGHRDCPDPISIEEIVEKLDKRRTPILLVVCGCRGNTWNAPVDRYTNLLDTHWVKVLFCNEAGTPYTELTPSDPPKQLLLQICEKYRSIDAVIAHIRDCDSNSDISGMVYRRR